MKDSYGMISTCVSKNASLARKATNEITKLIVGLNKGIEASRSMLFAYFRCVNDTIVEVKDPYIIRRHYSFIFHSFLMRVRLSRNSILLIVSREGASCLASLSRILRIALFLRSS